jgi:hypothetical protein
MGDMKSALRESLRSEQMSVRDRFEKAENILGGDETKKEKGRGEPKRPRVIRDTFSFPEHDYRLIVEIQERCLKSCISVTKSEILRAGLKALSALPDVKLVRAMSTIERIKTGRPSGKV